MLNSFFHIGQKLCLNIVLANFLLSLCQKFYVRLKMVERHSYEIKADLLDHQINNFGRIKKPSVSTYPAFTYYDDSGLQKQRFTLLFFNQAFWCACHKFLFWLALRDLAG